MKAQHAAIAAALRERAEIFAPYSVPRGHVHETAIAVGHALSRFDKRFRMDKWCDAVGALPPEEKRT
jgi:hypothetical protein